MLLSHEKNRDLIPNNRKWLVGMKHTVKVILGAAVLGMAASAASAATLDDVKAKGFVQCGVNTALAGFSAPNDKGEWTGLDVDFCRAVAAAVFGDGTKVKFTGLSAKDRFTALQSTSCHAIRPGRSTATRRLA
jgi:general L-amino acid transport system substrate-binding protein